jgi:hypothetical protein
MNTDPGTGADGELIIKALKSQRIYIRLEAGSRWLVWSQDDSAWFVLEHKIRSSSGDIVILYQDHSLPDALRVLLGDEESE